MGASLQPELLTDSGREFSEIRVQYRIRRMFSSWTGRSNCIVHSMFLLHLIPLESVEDSKPFPREDIVMNKVIAVKQLGLRM
jgi:hypothetical protein